MLSVLGFSLLIFALSFLLGSIPWGVVISRVFYHTDVREHGSGNIGTTNAMRTMGKVGGSAVFLLDFGKGVLSGIIGGAFAASSFMTDPDVVQAFYSAAGSPAGLDASTVLWQICITVAFLGCVWGHIFCPWLGFHGGKGIAVAVGCLFSTFGPIGALIELLLFAVLVIATRYVSVGSIAAAVLCPFLALYFFWGNIIAVVLCCLAAITVIWAHRENIARLRAGNENRVGSKKKAA